MSDLTPQPSKWYWYGYYLAPLAVMFAQFMLTLEEM